MQKQRPVLAFPVAIFTSIFVFFAQVAVAHEIRPSILDLSIGAKNDITLVMEINAEALLAGISAEHDDTNTAPEKAAYDALRQLEPAVLETRMVEFAPAWLQDVNLPWRYQSFDTGPVGDTDLARLSKVTLTLDPNAISGSLPLALPSLPGGIAIRVHRPDAKNAESHWLNAGDVPPVIDLPILEDNGNFWDMMPLPVLVCILLVLLAGGIWWRKRRKGQSESS